MSQLEEAKQKILNYLGRVTELKSNRDIARATCVEKKLVDKIVGELAKEGKIEFVTYGGASYVKLKK